MIEMIFGALLSVSICKNGRRINAPERSSVQSIALDRARKGRPRPSGDNEFTVRAWFASGEFVRQRRSARRYGNIRRWPLSSGGSDRMSKQTTAIVTCVCVDVVVVLPTEDRELTGRRLSHLRRYNVGEAASAI
jgi:hypothetical protein